MSEHDHIIADDTPYFDEQGRLVKYIFTDGCKRVTDRPLSKSAREAFPNPDDFDKSRVFLNIETWPDSIDGIEIKEGVIETYTFITESPK